MNYSDTIPYFKTGFQSDPLVGTDGQSCWTLAEANRPRVGDYLLTYNVVDGSYINRLYYLVTAVTDNTVTINKLRSDGHWGPVRLAWEKVGVGLFTHFILSNKTQRLSFRCYVKADEFAQYLDPNAIQVA
jgi:hypothetical protein